LHRTSFGAVQVRINSTLYYTLKDHLGSASVVTDASGNILGEQRYYPYGETCVTTGTIFTDKLFTGQREMAGLGIYHYGARFYSPKLGRFLSPDTIVPGAANPQAYNRYSYVLGNPLKYTDPTGHLVYCDPYEDCGSGGGTGSGGGGGGGNGGTDGCRHNDPDCRDSSGEDEPDFHIEVGNSDCDIDCQQTLQGIFVAATILDSLATGLNFAFALVADIGLFIGGPAGYASMLITYRGLSVIPNLIGSAGGALWIYSGFLSGENHFEMTVNDGAVDISGSIAQDTIAAVVFDGLGWSPLAADPNIATGINAAGVIYDIARNPFDPMLPTFFQPTFSFTIDTNNLGIP
jgi:RHS repeat-associated protein